VPNLKALHLVRTTIYQSVQQNIPEDLSIPLPPRVYMLAEWK